MNTNLDPILDYAPAPVGRRRIRILLFMSGAAIGAVTGWSMLWMVGAGGPIFPATLLFAPLAVVWESRQTGASFLLGLLVGAPLLYGTYALLWALPKRGAMLPLAACAHLVCFLITLSQRDAW